jgi:hypothetical protein
VKRARLDPSLRARVVARRPLFYADGADASEDRPGHVRAGSALAWWEGRLCVVQDDAAFLALLDGPTGAVRHVTLERGPDGRRQFDDGRGNKKLKLDLEACAAFEHRGAHRLLALGSGSSPARERVLDVRDERVRTVDAGAFYAQLRARTDFSGSELNLEGVVVDGAWLLLLQRGNGAPREGLAPRDATARVELDAFCTYLDEGGTPPPLGPVETWDLGKVDGARLTFTDGLARGGRVLYLAAAESSPDAVRDGPVAGVALGVLGDAPRYALVEDEVGAPLRDKLEGLALDRTAPDRLLAVADKDAPDAPCELVTIALEGDW